jgi:TatD DNase family protein
MGLIDTHTHLYLPEFDDDNAGRDTVERAISAGVERMIFPNVDLTTVEPMQRLAAQFPNNIYMAMGLHPTEVKDDWQEVLAKTETLLNQSEYHYVAVGEIGMDLYWDTTYREQQMQVFERQCRMAVDMNLPIIIHCREGLAETLEIVSKFPGLKAVFHSFGGTVEDIETIRRIGDFYFGINGIVTFKNSKLREVLPTIGIDRILLETDAPYLAPVPYRGKRNESAYIVSTAHCVADALGVDFDLLAERSSANACRLFNLT